MPLSTFVGRAFALSAGLIVLAAPSARAVDEDAPAWWAARGVFSAATADDYGLLNQGQLKQIAKAAREEMDEKLAVAGGSGTAISSLVNSWQSPGPTTDDYAVVNLGQLKAVTDLFLARLIALGFKEPPLILQGTWTYPYARPDSPGYSTATDDYPYANVGQAKNLFRFNLSGDTDGDGMPNWWEYWQVLNPNDASDAGLDPDGDGLLNIGEYQAGTDPQLPDTDFDGQGDFAESLDSDGDGVNDGNEAILGTDPHDPDSDNDGFWDGVDLAPTNPNVAASLGAPVPGDTTAPQITLLKP